MTRTMPERAYYVKCIIAVRGGRATTIKRSDRLLLSMRNQALLSRYTPTY